MKTGETGLMGENPLNRKDEVTKFYSNLERSFTEIIKQANWGTDASKIYQKVTPGINKNEKVGSRSKIPHHLFRYA